MRLVGKLIFLTNSHLDLAFSVQYLSQVMKNSCVPYWNAAIRVLHYLSRDPHQGLLLNSHYSYDIEAYCVAD